MSTTHHAAHDRVALGERVDQPSARPTAKLVAVGATGIATAAVLALAAHFGLALPEPVAEAIVLLGAWLGGYVKRDKAVAAIVTRVQAALAPILGTPAGAALEAVLEADVAAAIGGTRPVAMLGSATRSAAELGLVAPEAAPAATPDAEAVRGPEA